MTMHILLVENNQLSQRESLRSNLENQNCQITVVHTAQAMAQKTETLWPNAIVFNSKNCSLDLPNLQDTLETSKLNIPYVIVGEKNSQTSPNALFLDLKDSGKLGETITRATDKQKDRFTRLPNLVIDRQRRQILRGSQDFHLTPKEFRLLMLLVEYKDRDLSRRAIMKEVWETDYMGDTRTLDVHIRWLREKIEDDANRPRRIITVRGVGYRLIAQPI